MGRVANVYYNGILAGKLEEHNEGFSFTYAEKYLAGGIPVAFRLPLQEQPLNTPTLPAFFENLVSEGWLRRLQSLEQKIDEQDRFGLLLQNGKDLIGAVTVEPAN